MDTGEIRPGGRGRAGLRRWRRYYSPPAPSDAGGAPAQPAKTSIEIGVAPAGARSPELHLFQDPEGHDEVPDIRMHVQDGSLIVTLHTDPPPEAAAPESQAAAKR